MEQRRHIAQTSLAIPAVIAHGRLYLKSIAHSVDQTRDIAQTSSPSSAEVAHGLE